MSKLFGATVSDAISLGSPARIANVFPVTYCAWINPTGFGNPTKGTIFSKVNSSGVGHWVFIQSASGGQVGFQVSRASVNAQALAAFPASKFDNEWKFLVAAYQANDGGPRLFLGSHATLLTEMTYASRADGSGAVTDVTANALLIGNTPVAGGNAFQGRIGNAYKLSGVPALPELRHLLGSPALQVVQGAGILGHWPMDMVHDTVQVRDASGNGLDAVSITGTKPDKNPAREMFGSSGY